MIIEKNNKEVIKLSNNNYNSDLIVLILTGKITLNQFKEKVEFDSIHELHPETGKSIPHFISASNRFDFASDSIEWLNDNCQLDINHKDSNGNTMLHIAAEMGNRELLEYLLFVGADVNAVNKQGETAIFCVFHTFEAEVAEVLLRHGLDVDIENIDGDTILDIINREDDPDEYEDILEQLNYYKLENTRKNTVSIYNESKINKIMKDITDGESPTIPLYNKMLSYGEKRILSPVSKEIFEKVDSLIERFPHFQEAIDYVKEQISLSLLSNEPYFSMKPLLMYGGPGVGKTRFNIELNKMIGGEFLVIDGGNISASFVIGGSSPTWRDSSPGKVAKQLINGNVANPIVQLDEIDKMSAQQGYDPYGPLHPLLESKTASEFEDEFVGIPLDCSYVNWIATANNLSSIPDPILDRFLVVNIPSPSKEQMIKIASSVYNDIINDPKNPWGERFHDKLDDDILDGLSGNTPRQINRILLSTMGKVALKEMDKNRPEDSLISIKKEDISDSKIGKKVKIGMI